MATFYKEGENKIRPGVYTRYGLVNSAAYYIGRKLSNEKPSNVNMLYATFEIDERGVLCARIPDGYNGPTFEIDERGVLCARIPDGYNGPSFYINEKGKMEVFL